MFFQEEILVSLLAAGADPNLPQPDPVSLPLLCALERRWWRGAELLLDAGADAKAMDLEHDQQPATFLARDNVEILIKLLKEGCAHDEICSWIVDGIFNKTEVKKLVEAAHKFGPGFVTESLLFEILYIGDHDSAIYLLDNFKLPELLPKFIDGTSWWLTLIDWNPKMKYITALTENIFRNEKDKSKLLVHLFMECFIYCPVNNVWKRCNDQCNWIRPPKTQSLLETQLESLKLIITIAENNGLPIERWILPKHKYYSLFEELLEEEHSQSSLNMLNAMLHTTQICGFPIVLKLLPLFRNKGFLPTVSSLVAFVTNGHIVRLFKRIMSGTSDAILHAPESGYRILLSELTKNCCRDGQCWFRSSMLTGLCRDFVASCREATVTSLLLLHLGVHFTEYEEVEVNCSSEDPSRLSALSVFHRYAPRCRLVVTRPSFYPPPDAMRSLKELCRLSIRAALGHCRIEEKTEGLRGVLPRSLREYLYFRHDFLIFPAPANERKV
ncbi:uncharacterized protein LOC108675127 [Hyalella azteca]|uniref:Uncharacterized protein LOC108675127 n=1 Tax=Hyalella azteca TaxID=294128 RepID=A0A8B7NXY1_HYAAZ|nr:uncharacterized protein LOC108675127 [Hyalella azteca]